MAFVPGLSKSQVVKVIENYADLAPATMQLITDLSAQINDPLDPAAALIARMVTAESDIDLNESSISTLTSNLSTKAPLDSPTLSNPTLTGTITLPSESIANSKLVNSSISINGTSVSLGGNVTVTGTALPSQTDNAGKALVTDGLNLAWETVDIDTSALATLAGEETLSNKTLSSPVITTAGIIYGYGQFQIVDGFNIVYYDMGAGVPSIGETLKFENIADSNDYFNAVVSDITYPYGSPLIYQITTANDTNVLFDEAKSYSASALPLSISTAEISYLDGVTSNIQTQLDNKAALTALDSKLNSTNPQITISDNVTLPVVIQNLGTYNGPTGTSYSVYDTHEGYEELRNWAIANGASGNIGEPEIRITVSVTANGISMQPPAGNWISGTTEVSLGINSNSVGFLWETIPFEGNSAIYDNPTFTIGNPDIGISSTELGYLDGLTGNIQSQLNFDKATINGSLDDLATISLESGGVAYYTQDFQGVLGEFNVVLNYNDTTDLNSVMTVGQVATFVLMNKNGSASGYLKTILGSLQSTFNTKWQGGSAPTSGNANSVDIYTLTAVKTADNTFDVFADLAKFA